MIAIRLRREGYDICCATADRVCSHLFEARGLRRARDTQGAVGVPALRSGAGMER